MAKRIRLGDVIEIGTQNGLAYAQLTHIHPRFGPLLRILRGIDQTRPRNLRSVVGRETQFQTFFPLQQAVNRKIVAVIGNEEIPDPWKAFPVFRSGIPDPGTRKVSTWFLWDGERAKRIEKLTTAQARLPIKELVNDTLLIERIESGWTAESDEGV
jgi:hypothetical protein